MIRTQGRVLKSLHRGHYLMCDHDKEKITYRLSENQERVKDELIDRMLADGLIIPNGDDLFGGSQTYRLARGDELVVHQ